MPRRRHVLAPLMVFLLLGALANILVAFACASMMNLRHAPERFVVTHDVKADVWISEVKRESLGATQSIRRRVEPQTYGVSGDNYILEFNTSVEPMLVLAPGETIEREGAARLPGIPRPLFGTYFQILEPWKNSFGWPMRSMCCWLENQTGYPSSMTSAQRGRVSVVGGVQLDRRGLGADSRTLPLRPMWTGFIVNTIFYAMLLWLMTRGRVAIRAQRRMRRGLCPRCAYPIGSSPVCTECGAAVSPRLQTAAS